MQGHLKGTKYTYNFTLVHHSNDANSCGFEPRLRLILIFIFLVTEDVAAQASENIIVGCGRRSSIRYALESG